MRILALALVFLTTTLASAEEPLVAEARLFEARVLAALRAGDRAALELLVADGFLFIHSTGAVEPRAEYLAHAAGSGVMLQRSELQQADEAWHSYGVDTVVRYAKVTMRNKTTGAESRSRNLNVYVKTSGRGWQWVSSQSTRLPLRPAAAAVDTRAFDGYVGRYVIDGERSLAVARTGDTLVAVITGRTPAELIPSGAASFRLFNEDNDLGDLEVTFAAAADKKPAEAVLRANGRIVWRAKKSP